MVRVLRRRGVTLLELIVAIAIAATLAGIGVLAYARMVDDLRLNQAARQIFLDLTATRARALADNVGRRLVFESDRDVYQPQQQVGTDYRDDGTCIVLPPGIDLAECTASGSAVAFRPRGNAGTFGTITIRNRVNRERRIVIDIAGRIRVE
jgi:prepilin-type N-terminal cleavage/methylation domain-containing protein